MPLWQHLKGWLQPSPSRLVAPDTSVRHCWHKWPAGMRFEAASLPVHLFSALQQGLHRRRSHVEGIG